MTHYNNNPFLFVQFVYLLLYLLTEVTAVYDVEDTSTFHSQLDCQPLYINHNCFQLCLRLKKHVREQMPPQCY